MARNPHKRPFCLQIQRLSGSLPLGLRYLVRFFTISFLQCDMQKRDYLNLWVKSIPRRGKCNLCRRLRCGILILRASHRIHY